MKKSLMIAAAALMGLTGLTANAQTPQCCQNEGKCKEQQQCPAGEMNKMRQPREFTEFAFEGILLDIDQQTRIDSLNAAVKANRPARGPKCDKAACDKQDCKKGDKKCDKQDCPKCDKAACDKQDCKKGDKKCDKQDCPKCDKAACDKQDCKRGDKKCDKATCDKQDCKKHDKKHDGPHGQKPNMALMGRSPYGPEYVEKVKEILTPDQFTIFVENIQKMGPCKGNGADIRQAKGEQQKIGKADKGQRKTKPQKAAKKQK